MLPIVAVAAASTSRDTCCAFPTVVISFTGKALQDQITELREADGEINSNMGGVRFGVDANGNYGYKKVGADTVIPFKRGAILIGKDNRT